MRIFASLNERNDLTDLIDRSFGDFAKLFRNVQVRIKDYTQIFGLIVALQTLGN